jgi:hypothetical protein
MTSTVLSNALSDNAGETVDLLAAERGDVKLLEHPTARELLQAAIPARIAYIARDGTPRLVPVLFHWTGQEIVVTSWPDDPKVAALRAHPDVAVSIDTNAPPWQVLSLRGKAAVDIVEGVAAECLPTFSRYFGPEGGRAWVERMESMTDRMARIAIRPTWVDVLDFETRFPGGMARRMG